MIGREDELAFYREQLDDIRSERRVENALASEEREARRREREQADEAESAAAMDAYWDGVFRKSPPWSRQVIYSQDRG